MYGVIISIAERKTPRPANSLARRCRRSSRPKTRHLSRVDDFLLCGYLALSYSGSWTAAHRQSTELMIERVVPLAECRGLRQLDGWPFFNQVEQVAHNLLTSGRVRRGMRLVAQHSTSMRAVSACSCGVTSRRHGLVQGTFPRICTQFQRRCSFRISLNRSCSPTG